MVIKDGRSCSSISFVFSTASFASSLFLFICLPPSSHSLFCLCSCSPHSSNPPLLSPVCWNAVQLFNHSPETNQHLFGGRPRSSHCRLAVNTPATASLTPHCPDQSQISPRHQYSSTTEKNCMFTHRQYKYVLSMFLRFGVCGCGRLGEIFVSVFGAKCLSLCPVCTQLPRKNLSVKQCCKGVDIRLNMILCQSPSFF